MKLSFGAYSHKNNKMDQLEMVRFQTRMGLWMMRCSSAPDEVVAIARETGDENPFAEAHLFFIN